MGSGKVGIFSASEHVAFLSENPRTREGEELKVCFDPLQRSGATPDPDADVDAGTRCDGESQEPPWYRVYRR